MKNLLIIAPLVFNLISSPSSLGNRQKTSTPGYQLREQLRTIFVEKKASHEAKLASVRRERIRHFWGHMITRIEATIGRLERLIEKMEQRIAKIKESGENIDTSTAEGDIQKAKTLLSGTKTDLAEAKTLIEQVIQSEEPKKAFGEVIDKVHGIKKNLIEIHRLLVHAIGNIKGLRVGHESPTPTPTPTQ